MKLLEESVKFKLLNKILKLYKKYEEIINYIIIGGITTVISLAVKYGLLFTVFSASDAVQLQIAIVISWIVAVLFAYVANRIFVFKSKDKNILSEMGKFIGARLVTLLMEAFVMWFFVTFLNMDNDVEVIIWTLVAQVIVLVGNYVFSKIFVFNQNSKKE